MKILAIDLGKMKSVACDYESETAAHRFETVRTEPAILEDSHLAGPLHALGLKVSDDPVSIGGKDDQRRSLANEPAELAEQVEVLRSPVVAVGREHADDRVVGRVVRHQPPDFEGVT